MMGTCGLAMSRYAFFIPLCFAYIFVMETCIYNRLLWLTIKFNEEGNDKFNEESNGDGNDQRNGEGNVAATNDKVGGKRRVRDVRKTESPSAKRKPHRLTRGCSKKLRKRHSTVTRPPRVSLL